MKTLHFLVIRAPDGRKLGYEVYLTREVADEHRASGVDVEEVVNTIPLWAARWAPIWVCLQDAWNLKWMRWTGK